MAANLEVQNESFTKEWYEWVTHCFEENCEVADISRTLLLRGFNPPEARDLIEQTIQKLQLNIDLPNELGLVNPTQGASTAELIRHLPNLTALEHDQGTVYVLDNFLDDSECMQLNQRLLSDSSPSTIVRSDNDQVSNCRTSRSHEFESDCAPLFDEIDQQIAKALTLDNQFSEKMQGQIYQEGNKFDLHADYFEVDFPPKNEVDRTMSQRSWTAIVYLNTVDDGGETVFPELNLKIKPRAGTLIFWNNLLADGKPNAAMKHLGRPLTHGTKTILTKWFRLNNFGQTKLANNLRVTKDLTRSGFLQMDMPADVLNKLCSRIQDNESNLAWERDSDPAITGSSDTRYLDLSDETKDYCLERLQLILQSWVGREIETTCLYGIREYKRDAFLKMHVDRPDTHVVSVILCVESNDEKSWPLVIEDHCFRRCEVNLKAGEMLLYESARLLHGRPSFYTGESLKMAFAHYSLKQY